MINKICEYCKKHFTVHNYREKTARFCSISCSKKILLKGNTNGFKKGFSSYNKGKKRPGIGGTKKGNIPWNKGKKYLAITGEKNFNWKGGCSGENMKIRKSLEYKEWRTNVFKRDNYTCVICGCNESGKLNADHIKPFSIFPELRLDINNGRTLCIECHKNTDTYMKSRKIIEKLYKE